MIKRLISTFFSLWLLCGQVNAAVIEHAFVEQNTNQTKTGDTNFSDISGASLAADWSDATFSSGTGFEVGKKYFIYITGQIGNSSSDSIYCSVQVLHGSTAFEDDASLFNWKPISSAHRITYNWWTVWTAVSGEGIKVQHAILDAAQTVSTNKVAIFVMNLSDDLTEDIGSGGDWKYAERTNDDTLTTSPFDGASITFTPAIASQDWLILSLARIDHELTASSVTTTMDRSGEATSTTPSTLHFQAGGSTGFPYSMGRVFSLGNASNTFKEISVASANDGHVRRHSKIFALNLNKFKNHTNASDAYTEAAFGGLSATDYASQIQTISITPDVQSNVWIGAFWNGDLQNNAREAEFRVQVDGSDRPDSQTTDNYQMRTYFNAADEEAFNINTMVENMSAASHNIILEASADSTTGTPDAKHRSLWAMTMELAAGGTPSTRRGVPIFFK